MRPLHKDIIGSAGEWKGRGEAGYWEVSRALSPLSAVAGQVRLLDVFGMTPVSRKEGLKYYVTLCRLLCV